MKKILNFIFAQVLGKHYVFANTEIMWKGVVLKVRIKYRNTWCTRNGDMGVSVYHHFLELKGRLLGSA